MRGVTVPEGTLPYKYSTTVLPGTSCGARRWASAEGCLRTLATHYNRSDAGPTAPTPTKTKKIDQKDTAQALLWLLVPPPGHAEPGMFY